MARGRTCSATWPRGTWPVLTTDPAGVGHTYNTYTQVTTVNGNKMSLTWTRLEKLLGDGLKYFEGETVTAAGREERRANAQTTVYFMENVNLGHGGPNMQNAVMAMQGVIADNHEYGGADKKTQYRTLLSYAPKHVSAM